MLFSNQESTKKFGVGITVILDEMINRNELTYIKITNNYKEDN